MNQPPPPPVPGVPAPAQPRTESLAITSLILGILSLTCMLCLTGVPAIICGHIARGRIEKSSGTLGGAGMALAGLIMGYLSLLLSLLIIPAILVPAIAGARNGASRVKAKSEIRLLTVAMRSYYTEY